MNTRLATDSTHEVTKPTIFLGRLASGKESGFCNFEELNSLYCWFLRNEEVEICILLDDMVMYPALQLFNRTEIMFLATSNIQ